MRQLHIQIAASINKRMGRARRYCRIDITGDRHRAQTARTSTVFMVVNGDYVAGWTVWSVLKIAVWSAAWWWMAK